MQPRVINVVASPVKQTSAKPPVLAESRKRSSQSAFFDDDKGDRHPLPVMMTDMSGQRFVVSKYGTQLVGANLSILFRTMTTQGYQESASFFEAAERRTSSTIDVRDRIRSRNTCFWGRIVDERFLSRLVLFQLEGFDSAEPRKLCLEHFSSTINPPAVSTCAELVMCVRNMLVTYEELWMLEWRESLESMMTGYFERFEANENRFLDVMEFFYQLQRAAQQPKVGVVFAGGVTGSPGGRGLHQGDISTILRRRTCGYGNRRKLCFPRRRSLELVRKLVQVSRSHVGTETEPPTRQRHRGITR